MRRRTRAKILISLLLLVLLSAGALVLWPPQSWGAKPAASTEAQAVRAETMPVEKGTLTDELRLNGALGYGEAIELPAAPGVITALPAAGKVIKVGARVYEVDGRPVTLFAGRRPFWRELARGVDDGQDVLQLERNLARLGFFAGRPDTRFDAYTSEAVKLWQKSLGLRGTGSVAAADIVTVNAPSIRVARVTGRLGQSQVVPLSYTATKLRAVVKLSDAQARELRVGTPVAVELPDGSEMRSTLAAVDPGGQPTGQGEGEDEKRTPPTATIEFREQKRLRALGPTSVRVTVQKREETAETLIVPVTALVATARDEYAVEVRSKNRIVRVPVRIGLVADARVQIVASGAEVEGAPADAAALKEGDEVVISR